MGKSHARTCSCICGFIKMNIISCFYRKTVRFLLLLSTIKLYFLVGKSHVPRTLVILYSNSDVLKVRDIVRRIRDEQQLGQTGLGQTNYEAYQIFITTQKTGKLNGDIAEVGVCSGSSAKLICEAKGNKILHLFDTFEGLPSPGGYDDTAMYSKGYYAWALEKVKTYLAGYSNVCFYKGLFPDTGKYVSDKVFSFVHLDVDIYQSTVDCLEFFYPRMNKGGIILSHDYQISCGVKKAFDDFFIDKQEIIIELSGSQCLVVKI